MVSLGVRNVCGVLCPLDDRGVRGGVGARNVGGADCGCQLRVEVTRLAEVLEAAEIELDRRVVAREELVEALAVSVAETEEEAALSLASIHVPREDHPGGKPARLAHFMIG